MVDLIAFCRDVAPHFAPLGGNRRDCAVVMGAMISSVTCLKVATTTTEEENEEGDDGDDDDDDEENNSRCLDLTHLLLLPPDVLDTGLAMLCAPITISATTSHDDIPVSCGAPMPDGGMDVSCRLRLTADADLTRYMPNNYALLDGASISLVLCSLLRGQPMPWSVFRRVSLWVHLTPNIRHVGDKFLAGSKRVAAIDMRRSAHVTTLGAHFCTGCQELAEVRLPASIIAVGDNFLFEVVSISAIDLRSTELTTTGAWFMSYCERLTAVHLPRTLTSVNNRFLFGCDIISSIDLSSTRLTTVGAHFMAECDALVDVALPDSLTSVGDAFLYNCLTMTSIDLSSTALVTLGSDFMAECFSLMEIHLPDSVRSVGKHFLDRCELIDADRLQSIQMRIASASDEP